MITSNKTINFESQIAELEALVLQMETGELNLEDSLQSFEKGVNLTKFCLKALKKAELRVKKLESLTVDAELEDFSVAE